MKLRLSNLGSKVVGVFFFLMIVTPTALQIERGLFLGVILFGTVLLAIKRSSNWNLRSSILIWMLICVSYSLFSIMWAVVQGAPGALAVSTVYVLWPILYVYMIGFSTSIDFFVFIEKVLVVGVSVSAISGILVVASTLFPVLSVFDSYFKLLDGGVSSHDGSVEFRLSNMTTVIYGVAFLASAFLLGKQQLLIYSKMWRIFFVVTLIVSIFVMFISGRRAFMVVGVLAVPLSVFFMRLCRIRSIQRNRLLTGLAFIGVFAAVSITIASASLDTGLGSMFDKFLDGFDFSDMNNSSSSRRLEQLNALIYEWQDSPLIGLGHGNATREGAGDPVPWAYELQYVALLFQTGILGMLIYSSAIVWLMYKMVIISRHDSELSVLLIPALVAMSCFLIANATNPYLSKFDYLWTLFLPVGLVNIGLTRAAKRLEHEKVCLA